MVAAVLFSSKTQSAKIEYIMEVMKLPKPNTVSAKNRLSLGGAGEIGCSFFALVSFIVFSPHISEDPLLPVTMCTLDPFVFCFFLIVFVHFHTTHSLAIVFPFQVEEVRSRRVGHCVEETKDLEFVKKVCEL